MARKRRRTRLRVTALPTLRDVISPVFSPSNSGSAMAARTMKRPATDRPSLRTRANSLRRFMLMARGIRITAHHPRKRQPQQRFPPMIPRPVPGAVGSPPRFPATSLQPDTAGTAASTCLRPTRLLRLSQAFTRRAGQYAACNEARHPWEGGACGREPGAFSESCGPPSCSSGPGSRADACGLASTAGRCASSVDRGLSRSGASLRAAGRGA